MASCFFRGSIATLVAASFAIPTLTQAENQRQFPDSFAYIGIEASYYDIQKGDSKTADVDNFWRPAIQLGYRFNPLISLQAQYGYAEPKARVLPFKVKDQQFSLSTKFHLYMAGFWGFEPYLGAGYNRHELKPKDSTIKATKEDMLFAEIGLQRMLGQHFMLDFGYRHLVTLEKDHFVDRQPFVAINWVFGKRFKHVPVEEVIIPIAEPETIVVVEPKCKDVPAGAKLDEDGCPMLLEKSIKITLHIEFPFNESVVPVSYKPEVQRIADALIAYPDSAVLLEGHTDNVGGKSYNQSLSLERANAVMRMLVVDFDIKPTRIVTSGMGMVKPIASNATEQGRAENRRVEAIISATKEEFVQQDTADKQGLGGSNE